MSCENEMTTPLPCVDCPPPAIVTPCLNGEPCIEVIPAECVSYKGAPLSNINIATNDRLTEILTKLNINNTSTGILTTNTNSVTLTGSGLGSSRLLADVKVDTVITNLIKVTSNGLKVEIDKSVIAAILSLILNDAVLKNQFCQLATSCTANACSIPSSVSVTMSN